MAMPSRTPLKDRLIGSSNFIEKFLNATAKEYIGKYLPDTIIDKTFPSSCHLDWFTYDFS